MSDDRVRLCVEASVVSVSSSLVFLGNSVQKMRTSASYRITMQTRISISQVKQLRCHLKYISEKYIKCRLSCF